MYANTDQSSIDKTSTCLDGEKAPNPLSSPNSRKSTSPTCHGPEKRLIIETKNNKIIKLLTEKNILTKKKKMLKKYQVNKKIMNTAKPDAIFMHCLPASREEEVTSEVLDGKNSVVWLQAFNRIHAQKSIIEWCMK